MTSAPLPNDVRQSHLWKRLLSSPDASPQLEQLLLGIRNTAAAIGAEAARVIPSFTDHSVRHMDALWGIAGEVFTDQELDRFSTAEAFILGCSFYVHDLGMAFAATREGADEIRSSDAYKTISAHLRDASVGATDSDVDRDAIGLACRQLHATKAVQLTTEPLPGLSRHLIESTELRAAWASHIANVSASHHWPLTRVDSELGAKHRVSRGSAGSTDLAFVACALRIIDYAHINFERAPALTRALRERIDPRSLVHWAAQEKITGPLRDRNQLVFNDMQRVQDADAWWLFFELASGLDLEIRGVRDYLQNRTPSAGRFSLEGVKGIGTPEDFARQVTPGGFDPVDVRFRPDSMERLIETLGGRSLYGDDPFAPVRELLQNARDAIVLRRYLGEDFTPQVEVQLEEVGGAATLRVTDNGVGMTTHVATHYLLGVASNFWHSADFFAAYGHTLRAGFKPAGRFGIGFLSVFLLGDAVEVETYHATGGGLKLSLKGVGRRGTLQHLSSGSAARSTGTSVRVSLSKTDVSRFRSGLHQAVRAKAPMLDIPVHVTTTERSENVLPGWWRTASSDELNDFLLLWSVSDTDSPEYLRRKEKLDTQWPDGEAPEVTTETFRVVANPSEPIGVLVCTRGIAIQPVRVPGIGGIAEVSDIEVDAARGRILSWQADHFRLALLSALTPNLQAALSRLSNLESLPAHHDFLEACASAYGTELFLRSDLPWISVVEPPGSASLISAAALSDRLAGISCIGLLVGDLGPWRVRASLESLFPDSPTRIPVIPVPARPYSFGGSDERKDVTAPLDEHFTRRPYRPPRLLEVLLAVISSAWSVPPNVLRRTWVRRRGQVLGAVLMRNP